MQLHEIAHKDSTYLFIGWIMPLISSYLNLNVHYLWMWGLTFGVDSSSPKVTCVLTKMGNIGLVKCFSRLRKLPWVHSLEPTRWQKRTKSWGLSLDLMARHVCHGTCMPALGYIRNTTNKQILRMDNLGPETGIEQQGWEGMQVGLVVQGWGLEQVSKLSLRQG